jgi:hypothetical protein
MTALAHQLEQDFCKEPRIRAIIVDDFRAATFQWDPIQLPEFYASAERGEYYLDRTTGEERVEFSTKRGRGVDGFVDLAAKESTDASRTYKGVYRNKNFGYSASIPAPKEGISEVPAALEAGILINLSGSLEHYIWLGGSYTARYNSLAFAADAHVKWLTNEGANILTTSRRPVRLGDLRAERVILKYKTPESDVTWIEDLVLAIRLQPDEYGIVYQIEMRTTESDYSKDVGTFNQIVQSWRTIGFTR